jgi:N utilization substance protein A
MTDKNELLMILNQFEENKNIKKKDILIVIENALISAYKKHAGKNANIDVKVDFETGKMIANVKKIVVENVKNPYLEICVKEAKKHCNKFKIGNEIKISIDIQAFSRIAAQTAKQVIIQKIKESEKILLIDEMSNKINQIVDGFIYRSLNKNFIVDLGKTEAILPSTEQIFSEKFDIGQRIKTVIIKVDKNHKGSFGIVLSRKNIEFVKKLFEMEVPEIYDKVIEIVDIVREPGVRTKIAVLSHNQKVDPIGACVGVRGSRVKPIIDELRGEKIDLVAYSVDPIKYIAGSLSPAKIMSVNVIDDKNKNVEVFVNNDMLSLAIGKNGHNVRLAAKLTGWHIDVRSK